jgi:lipopolysaccharide transport system permease protein
MASAQPLRQSYRIQPSRGWRALDLAELWRYRGLVYFLAWRDVKVRYRQTALGVLWSILQPVAAMAVFTLFLGDVVRVPSDGIPYAVFALSGLVPWMYFANAATNASNSLVANTNLVSKVYFPRLAIPLSAVLAGLVDFAIGFVLLLVLLLTAFDIRLGLNLLLLPLVVVLAFLTATSVGVWLSALDVQYRDVRYAFPFLIQIWLFATPVIYPATVLSGDARVLLALNPMTGVVEGFRWALLGETAGSGAVLLVSALSMLVLLVSGLLYFRRMERRFADII